MSQTPLFSDHASPSGTVECLGLQFASDEERRAYFTEKLREKLRDPEFRKIEGFPIGSDEDILALSDPPYYTTCPNPFIEDFVRVYGKPYDPSEVYRKEPFAADVSEGKNDPIYNAHSYHTKVPHKAIMRYILHYTKPGDLVLDGFCGTGMTGVAAQMCAVPDGEFRAKIEQEWKEAGWGMPQWGARRAVLGDLSPAATFIAYNYNTPINVNVFEIEARHILDTLETECGWMYETKINDGPDTNGAMKGIINFTLLSDVFVCRNCGNEIIYWEVAVDLKAAKVVDEFSCPKCHVNLTKRAIEHVWITKFDTALGRIVRQIQQVPVRINFTVGKKRFEKQPGSADISLINSIEESLVPYWYPSDRMPEGDEARRNDDIGITHVHHFYDKRNLWLLAALRDRIFLKSGRMQNAIMLAHSATNPYASKMRRFRPDKKGGGPLSGTLYISSLTTPPNVISSMRRNTQYVQDAFKVISKEQNNAIVTTISSTHLELDPNSIDYIFTDPPFGANFWYSDLNFIWESWLKVFTNNSREAVQSKA
jgi:rubredoxin